MDQISLKDIYTPSGKLEIFLFNVGQGDHLLLKFPTGEYGIIDFHYNTADKIPEPPSLSYFKELKRTLSASDFEKITISFFCISHTDKDHIKGVTETLKIFDEMGIFIKDIWLGGAISKIQLDNFLKRKVPSLFKKHFNLLERLKYKGILTLFDKNVDNFSTYFEKWKQGKFESKRHINERKKGEYLVETRPLPEPAENCEAFNIGPRTIQLEDYYNDLELDLVKDLLKRIYKIEDITSSVDKNLMSHILRLRFGKVNMLFGGDTERKIWEECLDYYNENKFDKNFGTFDSHFIKVSHHGSKNSSSPTIWEKIIPKSGKVYLGLSAGRHNGYKHPHSETLKQIRDCRIDARFLSTNICQRCFGKNGFEIEYHKWYDDFVEGQRNYKKGKPNQNDNDINRIFDLTTVPVAEEETQISEMGLFAYIIEVPSNLRKKIKVRVALTKMNKSYDCFFTEHQEKLQDCCE